MSHPATTRATSLVAVVFFAIILSALLAEGLKPEIQHKFREPEIRPPVLVSTFFTILVALPAVILFMLWSKSVNLNFERLTLRRCLFHVIFLNVLGCYAKFWFGTNMFDTMRYTAPLIFALFYVLK